MMRERELFIGGAWRPAKSGRRLEIRDPATGERVGSTALADAADVDLAVAAAKRALCLDGRRCTRTRAPASCTAPLTSSSNGSPRSPIS